MGAKAAEALTNDAGTRERAIEQARRVFAIQALQAHRARRRFAERPALLGIAAFALGVGLYWLFARPAPLQYQVNGKAAGTESWLAASADRPLVVSFSDGTMLDVGAASRARVIETTDRGADISIESGSLHAQVTHTSRNTWGFVAGPFVVHVTGTSFDLKWEPAAQEFALSVSEGSAVVSGSIVGSERPVRAGERLFASVARGRIELSDADAAANHAESPPAQASASPSASTTAQPSRP
jgi:ferric-dicitrate binding protein FerR (iron transport regulator)